MTRLTIEKSVFIAAPAARVFDALTDPDQLVQFFPVERVESDRCAGGAIRLFGVVDGAAFVDDGRIDIYEAPGTFQYTYWSDNHGTERSPTTEMTIRYSLREETGGTRVDLHHDNLLTAQRHAQMRVVWDFLLDRLREFVEDGAPRKS